MSDEAFEREAEEENYFVSMTDMMVGLVFIFIIMLMYYAVQLQSETSRLDGSQTRSEILIKLKDRLESDLHTKVEIDLDKGVLHLPESILFDSASADLKPAGLAAVKDLAAALADTLPQYSSDGGVRPAGPPAEHLVESVYVEGHTDTDAMNGVGLIRNNWDLSAMRATHTFEALIAANDALTKICTNDAAKVCEPVMSVSGYGPQRPVDLGTSDQAKQHNRRIDLRIVMATPDSGVAVDAVAERIAKP
jgi:flagellar motor protein MotB